MKIKISLGLSNAPAVFFLDGEIENITMDGRKFRDKNDLERFLKLLKGNGYKVKDLSVH